MRKMKSVLATLAIALSLYSVAKKLITQTTAVDHDLAKLNVDFLDNIKSQPKPPPCVIDPKPISKRNV